MAFTYILECADGTLYTGWTTDIEKRLLVHNEGRGAKYTRARLPVKLAYMEKLQTNQLARQRECAIKKLTRNEKLNLIEIAKNDRET